MDGTGDLFEPFVAALDEQIETQVVRYPFDEPLNYVALEAFVRERFPTNRAFILLGESFSGPIAISIASKPPENLAGLVLCCTFVSNPVAALSFFKSMTLFLPIERAPRFLVSRALMGNRATPTLRDALDRAMARVSPHVLRARATEVLSSDYSRKLASIDKPVLYLRATRDRVVHRRSGDEILRHCKHTQLVEIDGPHFLLQTRATETADAIANFVNRVHGSSEN
jgi:pimeloyl-[acyl-carrier protein] methyl ester esterase